MSRSPVVFLLVFALCLAASDSLAVVCFHLDFDNDDDPWTLRTQLPDGVTSGLVKIIFEVPSTPPAGESFWASVDQGCCNDQFNNGHYGLRLDGSTLDFDPDFVSAFDIAYPTCTFCCSPVIMGSFRPDAPMLPGERYFIGHAEVEAVCEDYPPQCYPEHTLVLSVHVDNSVCSDGTTETLTIVCPTSGAPDDPPRYVSRRWGRIKAIYR